METVDTWYKAQGSCPAEDYELASYLLFEAGVKTLEELDSKDPSRTEFCFYTGNIKERNAIVAQFSQYNFVLSQEPAKDWDKWWHDQAKPISVSPHLWVRPPWVEFKPDDKDATVLVLEAKSAFGTGSHETTACTATLMERLDLKGKTLLDIGTGTGILAMFAKKRGARLAVGTEIDPLAIPCLTENFARNGLGKSNVVLGFLNAFREDATFDVVVCNMIRTELWPMRSDMARLLSDGGSIIISGQLFTEKKYIEDWFSEIGVTIQDSLVRNEWWTVRGTRTK